MQVLHADGAHLIGDEVPKLDFDVRISISCCHRGSPYGLVAASA
jgi:hypothetical protein